MDDPARTAEHSLLLASTINEGIESIVSALNGHDTPMYGNFNMGYHEHTPEGVVADEQFQQAMGLMSCRPVILKVGAKTFDREVGRYT